MLNSSLKKGPKSSEMILGPTLSILPRQSILEFSMTVRKRGGHDADEKSTTVVLAVADDHSREFRVYLGDSLVERGSLDHLEPSYFDDLIRIFRATTHPDG